MPLMDGIESAGNTALIDGGVPNIARSPLESLPLMDAVTVLSVILIPSVDGSLMKIELLANA